MFGIENKELYITKEDLALLESASGFDMDPILLVHSATLLVPSLINVGFISMSKTVRSVMDFTSEEIAIACRLMVLDLYGLLFPLLLNKWNLKNEESINTILLAFQQTKESPPMAVAHKITITSFDFAEMFKSDPLFMEGDFEEVKMARDVMQAAQSCTVIRGSTVQSEKPKGFSSGLGGLLSDLFGDMFKPPDKDA